MAFGNGAIAHPGVIKLDQNYVDVVGPWGSNDGLDGASGAVDETVADVHVDGQHDLGSDCDAQLFTCSWAWSCRVDGCVCS